MKVGVDRSGGRWRMGVEERLVEGLVGIDRRGGGMKRDYLIGMELCGLRKKCMCGWVFDFMLDVVCE